MTNKPEPLDLEALRAKALAATEGPWEVAPLLSPRHPYEVRFYDVDAGDDGHPQDYGHQICEMPEDHVNDPDNAAFIAAANPQTVLALIKEVERLRTPSVIGVVEIHEENDELKAENACLRAALGQAEAHLNDETLTHRDKAFGASRIIRGTIRKAKAAEGE